MSAVCLKLLAVVCVCGSALSSAGRSGVVQRDHGGSVTIQCRFKEGKAENLNLRKGLSQDTQVLFRDHRSENNTITQTFRNRLQVHGAFPDLDILIQNLTAEDTGVFWCEYETFNKKSHASEMKKGEGSVLLVVTEKLCGDSDKSLVLVSVVITAIVLLALIASICTWICICKQSRTRRRAVKPRAGAGIGAGSNDVYEDMRGTNRS